MLTSKGRLCKKYSKTKDLWVGDVGQNRFEEINIVRSGENLGWNIYEGYELFSTKFKKDTKKSFKVVVTGGFSKLFKNSIKTKVKQNFDITINGLIKASKLIK